MKTIVRAVSYDYDSALSVVKSLNVEERKKLIAQLNREQMLEALQQTANVAEEIPMEDVVAEVKRYRNEKASKGRS